MCNVMESSTSDPQAVVLFCHQLFLERVGLPNLHKSHFLTQPLWYLAMQRGLVLFVQVFYDICPRDYGGELSFICELWKTAEMCFSSNSGLFAVDYPKISLWTALLLPTKEIVLSFENFRQRFLQIIKRNFALKQSGSVPSWGLTVGKCYHHFFSVAADTDVSI